MKGNLKNLLRATVLNLFILPWAVLFLRSMPDDRWGEAELGSVEVQIRALSNAREFEGGINRFVQANRRAPVSLEEMVTGGTLKRIPINPFSGSPVRVVNPTDEDLAGNVSYKVLSLTHVRPGEAPVTSPRGYSLIAWGDGTLRGSYPFPAEKFLKNTALAENGDKILWVAGDVEQISGKYGDGSVDIYPSWQEAWPVEPAN